MEQQKTIVVTGFTSGIGHAIAEQLAAQGAHVIGVGRSTERCQAAQQELAHAHPAARITTCVGDLALQSDVRRLGEEIQAQVRAGSGYLDGLVNNAGMFGYWMTLTAEGFESAWAVNHLAPFLLTHELLPLLQAAPQARVVTVSSDSHYSGRIHWDDPQMRRRYNGLSAYSQSKLANVLFTAELRRRLGPESSVQAFAADPGLVKTEIGFKGTPGLVGWIWRWRSSGGISAAESAQGVVYLVLEAGIQNSPEVYWKHSRPKPASKRALDENDARRLWALSEHMCGLPAWPA